MDENNNPIQEPGVNNTQNNENYNQNGGNYGLKTSPVALVSFILSLVGFWVLGVPLGIASVITGIVGLTTFKPEVHKGKGFAIAGLVIGVIDIIGAIIVAASGILN